MPITTFNSDYYDDYTLNRVGEKNYVKILFKPGYSVQVRELNQMQSMLQDQIHRLGSTLYTQEKAVLGCKVNFIPTVHRVDFNLTLDENLDKTTILENVTSIVSSTGLIATVIGYKDIEEDLGLPDKVRFYIKYTNSGTNNIKTFDTTDVFDFVLNTDAAPELAGYAVAASLMDDDPTFASCISSEEGVFYVNGSFVALPKQILFVDHELESEVLSGVIVFRVDENIITYQGDETLLDNSAGALNYTAPGADRYQIDLSLLWFNNVDWAARDNTIQYVKIGEITNSRLSENINPNSPQYLYNQIDKTLALRTQEESGNYTVNPFPLVLSDFYNGQNLPAKYMVKGNRYRVETLGVATTAEWIAAGVTDTISVKVGTEFIATGSLSIAAPIINQNDTPLVTEVSFINGRYKWNDLDLIPTYENYYSITSTDADKLTAINRAKGSFLATIDKSSGYVDGYRVFLDSPYDIETPKSRTSQTFPLSVNLSVGNYFRVTVNSSSFELPPINNISALYNLNDSGGNTIGTCKVKSFEAAGGSEFLLYVFDIKTINSTTPLSSIASIRRGNFVCNKVDNTSLYSNTQKSYIYTLPYPECDAKVGITTPVVSAYRHYDGQTSGTVLSLQVGSETNEIFEDSSSFIVYVGGTRITSGIELTGDGRGVNIALGAGMSNKAFSVIAAVRTNTAPTKKILATATTTINSTSLKIHPDTKAKLFTLPNTDVIEIISVINTRGGGKYDVTPVFTLEFDGLTDTYYTNARIEYTGDSDVLTGTFTIQYRYFSRSGGGNLRYFAANSYSAIDRRYIKNTASGTSLRDTLDFRPDLLESTPKNGLLPNPNSTLSGNAHYYLPRIDKVVVNSNNNFTIVEGVPSLNPREPDTPANAMCLYILDVPAYTADPSKIGVRYIDNRRYTMRDIAKLDKRIGNLEYYTSLSLLERSATEKSLFTGTEERFKNGIIVDSFLNHSIGDGARKEHICSIDKRNGILRPGFKTHHIPLEFNESGKQNVRIHSDTITLDYSEKVLFQQLLAMDSISVQPHLNAQTVGNISLYPSVDDWKDTETIPAKIVEDDNAFRAIQELIKANPELIGVEFGSWLTTNVTSTVTGQNTVTTKQTAAQAGNPAGSFGVQQVFTTTQNLELLTTELRTGTNTTLGSNTVERSLGESVVDINLIPYMRSRMVWFYGSSFKENTELYAFFDDIAINEYVAPKSTGDELLEYYEEDIPEDSSAARRRRRLARWSNFLLRGGARILNNVLPKDFPVPPASNGWSPHGSQLKTNDKGEVFGCFIIPNNEYLKFRTGEREFRLISSSRNLKTADTYGMTKFVASGLGVKKQETILSTKEPTFTVTPISETRTTKTQETNVIQDFGDWYDPLAQSFTISSKTYKEGLFLTSIDLFFEKKGKNAPVSIYVVPTLNGYPTKKVVPYSRVSVRSEDVEISSDATAPTSFVFSNPIFLQGGEEYAFVVESPDPDYKAWISILGPQQTDVTTGLAYETQTFLGVFFTSSNASTWTAEQQKDLKCILRRAEFVSAPGLVKFDGVASNGIDKINIINKGNGYVSPPIVTIAPPPPSTGPYRANRTATATAVIDTVTGAVKSIKITDKGAGYTSPPTITIAPPITPGATRATASTSLYIRNFSLINCAQNQLTFDTTTVKSELVLNGKTTMPIRLNRGEDSPIPKDLIPNDNIFGVDAPCVVTSVLTSSDSSISPVIDILKNSLIAVENVINKESDLPMEVITNGAPTGTYVDSEINSRTGKARARYLTRPVSLNDPADKVHIYIAVNRPAATSNIKVYARALLENGDDENIYDNDWTLLESRKSSDPDKFQAIPVNSNAGIYPEILYIFDLAKDFVTFQVKIVMVSDNIIEIPTVKDFRAIASI